MEVRQDVGRAEILEIASVGEVRAAVVVAQRVVLIEAVGTARGVGSVPLHRTKVVADFVHEDERAVVTEAGVEFDQRELTDRRVVVVVQRGLRLGVGLERPLPTVGIRRSQLVDEDRVVHVPVGEAQPGHGRHEVLVGELTVGPDRVERHGGDRDRCGIAGAVEAVSLFASGRSEGVRGLGEPPGDERPIRAGSRPVTRDPVQDADALAAGVVGLRCRLDAGSRGGGCAQGCLRPEDVDGRGSGVRPMRAQVGLRERDRMQVPAGIG